MTTLILHVYIYYCFCFSPKTREKVSDAIHHTLYSYLASMIYYFFCFPPKTREKVLDASNGDDGVLEVRRGTIVKQMMPYIASFTYGIHR